MKQYLRRLTTIVLVFLLASLSALSATGCVRVNTVWHDLVTGLGIEDSEPVSSARRLSEVEMVKLITGAIRGDQDLTAYYSSINTRQLDGLTQDEFQQYISLLRLGISGDVHSFTVMNDLELLENKQQMSAALPEQQTLIDSSIAYWIIYRQSGRNDERFAVYFQIDDEGQIYLSSSWIRQILQLSGYANLYFDALDSSDRDALAFLIDQDKTNDPVINAKAEFLIDFYQNNISSRTSEYNLNMARLDGIAYEQFGIINPDLSQAVSRTVTFRIDAKGDFSADDNVVNVLKKEDQKVLLNGELLFILAAISNERFERVWSYSIEEAIGKPFIHDDSNCKPYVDGVDLLNLAYNGISLSIHGDCQSHESWNGIVRSVKLNRSAYHTGSGLRTGQSVEELLIHYPFAEESEYRFRSQVEGGTVTMNVTVEDQKIVKIDLSFLQTEPDLK